ncbi:MAG: hypothetical protein Q8R92_16935 [Deltaproteobacteria bacterium]|nr:hypothetical protein [Deltaproteobacteria bacterium]
MAFAAPFLAAVGGGSAVAGGVLLAGTALTVISAISQASSARKASEYNAGIAERDAGIAREQAARDADAQKRGTLRAIGAARAAYGASGITVEGSPLDVLESSAAAAELDRQNILYKGELRAMGYQETAALDRARGKAATRQGYMQAGSAILMGAGKYYGSQPAKTAQTGYQLGDYGASDYSFDGV